MTKDRFFFEEDPEAEKGELTWEEHTKTFSTVMDKEGVGDELDLTPMQAASSLDTKHLVTKLVDIEYGTVREDYVIHITPTHPTKNLLKKSLFDEATKMTIVALNTIVPQSMNVKIFLPRKDWEVKATSYVIEGAADAWNFDRGKLESEVIPKLSEEIGKICMKA